MTDPARLRRIIGAVLRQALESTGRTGVVILDSGTPEARLLGEWCEAELGAERTWRATGDSAVLPHYNEALRYLARLMASERNALTAHAANKTVLLLSDDWPVEPLLPFGDLYATQMAVLAGGWSAPVEVQGLIEQAGGIDAVDHALESWLDRGQTSERGLAGLSAAGRGPFLEAVRRGRAWRERAGLVPKLATRTIGIDLFA